MSVNVGKLYAVKHAVWITRPASHRVNPEMTGLRGS
jgi:hypothetical protein